MSLGEIYFYTLTGLVSIFSFFIYLGVEDIKLISIFKKLFLIGLAILIIGTFLVLFDLSYLSNSKTIFIYSSPLIILLLNRILFWINNELFGEPFIYARGGFLSGFWYNKVVDEKKMTLLNRIYYMYYTILHLSQIFLFSTLFEKFFI
jgi:hypothetical protein